ncbi:MAG TPA: DsrE family protein [Nocardioides sp.]|nr:DsrE family protein [Nocardioides sp.]
MDKILMVVNTPAYGSDATFNALRLAVALGKKPDVQVTVFLMGDAVTCAIAGQQTPDGYYKLDRMLRSVARGGGSVACCGTCLDARGLTKEMLVEEAHRSTMDELAGWVVDADQVLTF